MLYTNTHEKTLLQNTQRPQHPRKMVPYKKQPPCYSFSKSKRTTDLHLRNDCLYYISTSNHIDIPYRKPNINQQSHLALSEKTMVNYRSTAPRCYETEKTYYIHRDCCFLESKASFSERIKREKHDLESFNQSKKKLNKKTSKKNYLKETISSENKSASFLSSGRDFSVLHYHGQLIYIKSPSLKKVPKEKKQVTLKQLQKIQQENFNNKNFRSPTNTDSSITTTTTTTTKI